MKYYQKEHILQGIVTHADREKLFSVVRARLKAEGYYMVSTAMFDEDRFSEDRILDAKTGIICMKISCR